MSLVRIKLNIVIITFLTSLFANANEQLPGENFKVGRFPRDIEKTDLRKVSNYHQIFFLKQVGQSLIEIGRTGEIVSGLAKTWNITKDQLKYTFTLREAFFHDGSKVTSYDIKKILNTIINSKENVTSEYLSVINNIEIKDKLTFEITLKFPYVPFLRVLSSGSAAIVKNDKKTGIIIGTGPYAITRSKNSTKLKAFSSYSGPYKPSIKNVRLIYRNENELPDYDVLAIGDQISWYDSTTYNIIKNPALVFAGFFVNTKIKKYNSKNERKKLLAILRDLTRDIIFPHPGESLKDIYPKGMTGHQHNNKHFSSFKLALDKITKKEKQSDPICISYNTMLGIEKKLSSNTKISNNVKIKRLLDNNTYNGWVTHRCDALFMVWQSVFLDPITVISPYKILDLIKESSEKAKFTKLIKLSNSTLSFKDRTKQLHKISELILNNYVFLPIYQPNQVQTLKRNYSFSESSYSYQPMISDVKRSPQEK